MSDSTERQASARAHYANTKAINWSSLKRLSVSPRLYKYRIDHPEPDKPSFALGRAAHCAILEPQAYGSRYGIFDGIRRGKAWDAWQEEHPGLEALKPHEAESIERIVSAVRENAHAAEALSGGRAEEVLTWTSSNGLACKGRVDYITPRRVVDLKTTTRLGGFAREVERYQYHGQLAWYHDGAIAAGALPVSADLPLVVAVESDDGGDRCFDCGVFELSRAMLDHGRALYRKLLDRFNACAMTNNWPGLCPYVQAIEPSQWLTGAEDEEDF